MKTKRFYFNCDTARGNIVLCTSYDAKSFAETGCTVIDARRDLRIVLEQTEVVKSHLPKKPSGLVWETFRDKSWCLAGFKP